MLTCLEATVEDLPRQKQDQINWLLFVRSNVPIIKRETMKLYPALTDLHATNAGVEKVEADAFRDLKELNWVDLSYNKLSALDAELFKEARTFYYLNVSGNPDLVIPKDGPFIDSPKLNWLDISLCGIKELYPNTFGKLRGLKVLSLAGNKLETLPRGVFQPLQNLYSLDLSNNLFRTVNPVVFKDMKHLSLYLGKNPWECDCSLYPLMEWVKTRRMKDEVRCAKPEDKLWKDVTISGCEASMVEVF
ncbi:UNVERIFIED_CONTAM: hypothetical protein PYX00_000037 [Menopon gallinae]|uniref:LRRCT domain-containing protein n=1 Tax=Menopon gallinae TaxID=328185 RepID=A0AAW2I8F3_9NEOP